MTSLFSSKTSTGIYIGSDKIAIAQVSRTIKGLRLDQVLETNIFQEGAIESDISDDSSTAFEIGDENSQRVAALKNLLTKYSFNTDNVSLALPSREIMVRYFSLPKVSKSELSSTVKFEAKKYIPFNIDEVISDYHIAHAGSAKKDMEILFAAAKQHMVKEYLSVLKKCDLNANKIRIPSLGLISMIYGYQISARARKSASYLMVDVNESVATITIFSNGIPYLIRDFSMGGVSDSADTKISDDNYENFIHELHLSLEYYYEQFPNKNVGEIFLFDDGTLNDKIDNLNSEFGISITKPNLNKLFKVNTPDDISPQSLLAICAASYEKLTHVDMNLMVPEKEPVSEEIFTGKSFALPRPVLVEFVALIIGLLILYIILGKKMMFSLQDQIESLRNDRAKINTSFIDMSEDSLKIELAKSAKKNEILSSLVKDRVYLTDKLSRIVIDLPDGVWIESLRYENRGQEINSDLELYMDAAVFLGSSRNEMDIVNQFLRDLKSDTIFMKGLSKVELSSVRKGEIKGFKATYFRLRCF